MSFVIPNLPLPPVVDYTSRDYSAVLNDLITQIPNFVPEWTDRSAGDLGIALLELFAYTADILNYYIDRAANEAYIGTASQYSSILNIASLLNYTPAGAVASSVNLQFTIANPSPSPVTVPAGSVATTTPQNGQSISFTTTQALTIWGDNATPTTLVYDSNGTTGQQVYLSGPFDGKTVTVAYEGTILSQINGGISAITSGTSITSIQFKSLRVGITNGDHVVIYTGFGGTSLTLTAGATVAASTSPVTLSVSSISANATYTPGTAYGFDSTAPWPSSWTLAPGNTFTGVSSTATEFVVLNGNTIEFGNNTNGAAPRNGEVFLFTYYPYNGSVYALSVPAIQAVQVTNESIGISSGAASQSFFIYQNPVVNNSITVTVTVAGVAQTWTYFVRLVDAGPSDLAYTTTTDQNGIVQVIFGDNINGLIPPTGAVISASYQVGGGSAGNVAANTITNFTGITGVIAVTNPSPATGGADAESIEHIRTHAPLSLTALGRAVTLADYAALCLSVSGIAKAAATSSVPNVVTVYIHPNGGFFTNLTQLSSVVTTLALSLTNAESTGYLDTRKIATTSVAVSPPEYNNGSTTTAGYVPVNVSVTVQVLPTYSQSSVSAAVQAAIAALLDFSVVDFGFRLTLSSVYQAIMAVPGVEYAQVTNLARLEASQPTVGDVVCAAYEIPMLNLPNQPILTINGGIPY